MLPRPARGVAAAARPRNIPIVRRLPQGGNTQLLGMPVRTLADTVALSNGLVFRCIVAGGPAGRAGRAAHQLRISRALASSVAGAGAARLARMEHTMPGTSVRPTETQVEAFVTKLRTYRDTLPDTEQRLLN